jgi:hypothetical protein
MESQDLRTAAYGDLLQAAQNGNQDKFEACIGRNVFNRTQITKALQLAMQGYQAPTALPNKKTDYALLKRIVIIKRLIEILEQLSNHRFLPMGFIDSFLKALRYQSLPTTQKGAVLIWAAKIGATDLIKWLCEKGVDSKEKSIALQVALDQEQLAVLESLYKEGAIVHNTYWKPFMHYVMRPEAEDTVQSVFTREMEHYSKSNRAEQMIIYAMKRQQDRLVEICMECLVTKLNSQSFCIDRRSSVTDNKGLTNLAIKTLFRRGSNTKKILVCAAEEGHTSVIRILLRADISIDTADQDGNTLLLIAARDGHFATVDFLLRHGANINIPNKEDMTPLKASLHSKQLRIFEHLLQHHPMLDPTILADAYVLHNSADNVNAYKPFITLLDNSKTATASSVTLRT